MRPMTRPVPQQLLTQNVAALLAERNMSYADLGRTLGWSDEDTAKLSYGQLNATLDQIDALARVLGAPPFDLVRDFTAATDRRKLVL